MHKLQGIAVTVIMFIGMLMAFEAMIPAADGAMVGIMGLLWAIIKPLFLHASNLHSDVCQLFLNKIEKKVKETRTILEYTPQNSDVT